MALENYRNDMLRCSRCSCCKYIPLLSIIKSKRFSYNCPAVSKNNFHAYSGSGKLIMALSLLENRIEWSDKLVDILFNCTLCGACDVSCRSGTEMEVWEILHEFRVRAFNEGKAPLPKHKPIMDSMVSYDNVWMQPRSARTKALREIKGMKDLNKEKAEVLYYVGCTYSLDPSLRNVVHNTAKILLKAGVDLGTMGKSEVCCASPAYTIGNEKLFNEYAKRNIEIFNNLGIKKIVTSCAGCYGMFNAHYKRLGLPMNFEVQSAIEFIDELIQAGELKPTRDVEAKVTYHDPCHLGRLSEPRKPSEGKEERILGTLFVKDTDKVMGFKGVFDPPRNVLKNIPGVDFREMERIREYSWCCGSGGGVKSGFPEFALWAANERIEEALSTGAEALVTNCPWCERNFKDAASEHKEGIKVLNTTELLIESLE
jgi:Fe-S oxidoreductase